MKREFRDTFVLRNSVCDAGYEWDKTEDGKPLLVVQNRPGVGLHMQGLHAGVSRIRGTQDATRHPGIRK